MFISAFAAMLIGLTMKRPFRSAAPSDVDIRLLRSTYYSVLKDRRYYLRPGQEPEPPSTSRAPKRSSSFELF